MSIANVLFSLHIGTKDSQGFKIHSLTCGKDFMPYSKDSLIFIFFKGLKGRKIYKLPW